MMSDDEDDGAGSQPETLPLTVSALEATGDIGSGAAGGDGDGGGDTPGTAGPRKVRKLPFQGYEMHKRMEQSLRNRDQYRAKLRDERRKMEEAELTFRPKINAYVPPSSAVPKNRRCVGRWEWYCVGSVRSVLCARVLDLPCHTQTALLPAHPVILTRSVFPPIDGRGDTRTAARVTAKPFLERVEHFEHRRKSNLIKLKLEQDKVGRLDCWLCWHAG